MDLVIQLIDILRAQSTVAIKITSHRSTSDAWFTKADTSLSDFSSDLPLFVFESLEIREMKTSNEMG